MKTKRSALARRNPEQSMPLAQWLSWIDGATPRESINLVAHPIARGAFGVSAPQWLVRDEGLLNFVQPINLTVSIYQKGPARAARALLEARPMLGEGYESTDPLLYFTVWARRGEPISNARVGVTRLDPSSGRAYAIDGLKTVDVFVGYPADNLPRPRIGAWNETIRQIENERQAARAQAASRAKKQREAAYIADAAAVYGEATRQRQGPRMHPTSTVVLAGAAGAAAGALSTFLLTRR